MILIKPIEITPSVLTDSSIPQPDSSVSEVEWTAGTYNTGTRRIMSSTGKLYEVVATPSTADQPDVGAAKATPTWIVVSATNRFRAFDAVIDTQSTEASSPLTIELSPIGVCNSIAGFNLTGVSDVTVKVYDGVTEVYDKTTDLTDDSLVIDEYTWCFSPIVFRNQFVSIDLPAYTNPTILVTFTGGGAVGVGELVIGNSLVLGEATYGTSIETVDYSVYETDDFGNRQVIRRRTADLVEFKVGVMKNRINYVRGVLKDVRGVNCVWFGEGAEDDATLAYGFGRGSRIPIETPSINEMIITVQGLV